MARGDDVIYVLFPVGELLESRAQDQSRPETVSRKAAPKKCDSGRLSGQAFRRAAIGLTVRQDALGPLAYALARGHWDRITARAVNLVSPSNCRPKLLTIFRIQCAPTRVP